MQFIRSTKPRKPIVDYGRQYRSTNRNLGQCKLLITDLDNTLYDWVTFFSRSFVAMLNELAQLLNTETSQLIDEFREVHRSHHNTEHPLAILELPSVRKRYQGFSDIQLLKELDKPLKAFNRVEGVELKLYSGVFETLETLSRRGITIVGHTESVAYNAFNRLNKLKIRRFFKHLYALEESGVSVSIVLPQDAEFITRLPKTERKPNAQLLLDICNREGVKPSEVIYVGDSITRDISMARGANIASVWARYGRSYRIEDWDFLVQITHWTNEDVQREAKLRDAYARVEPDFTIDEFAELKKIIYQQSSASSTRFNETLSNHI